MLYKLAGFSALLRSAGIRVSPSETEDFCRAVLLTGIEKGALEAAALATLAKGEREARLTQRFLALYFSPPDPAAQKKYDLARVLADPPRLDPGEFLARLDSLRTPLRAELDRLRTGEREAGDGGSAPAARTGRVRPGVTGEAALASRSHRLLEALSDGARAAMRTLAADAVAEVVKNARCCEVEEILRQVKVYLDWAANVDRLARESRCDRRALLGLENTGEFESIIIEEVDRFLWRNHPGSLLESAKRSNLDEIDFGRLNLQETEDMERLVARMARSLATRLSYRRARSGKGEVDLRRTARYAAQTGGIPLKLYRRARVPHRPDLVVLCDLSGSVSLFTGFMLKLIYTVQERFNKVRTFAFVDDVEEITESLKERDVREAIFQVVREARISHTPFSDYGAVWKEFCRKYLATLTPRTTVLVLGDARNNWKPTGTEYLERIRKHAARIIWLNPAPLDSWNREDSIIFLYAPYCHRLFECRNLKQLAFAARYIGRI